MQKLLPLALVLAFTSCDDDGPPKRPNTAADALWKLAPEGARGGIVMSPYAIGMIEGAQVAVRTFLAQAGSELDPLGAQLDDFLKPFGGRDATLASFGLTRDKGGALFFVKDGMVAVLPIGDRDAFLAKAKGTKAATPDGIDKIDTAACKLIDGHYTCATSEALLAGVGKGALAPQLAKVGARGDIEIVGVDLPLGAEPSTLVAVAQLERGSMVMRGVVIKPPAELASKLGPAQRPRTKVGQSSGFGVFDLRPLFEGLPPIPLVEGVTIPDLVKSIAGPLTITVPAGQTTLDMELPLSDPAPAQKVLAGCGQSPALQRLGMKLEQGNCKIVVDEAQLQLDIWLDGSTLKIGSKTPLPSAKSLPMTAIAQELANGQWSFAFWGRASIFSPTGRPTPTAPPQIEPSELTAMRVMSLLNEAGFAARKDTTADGEVIRFIAAVRTTFANPDPVLAKLAPITATDVIANTATAKAEPVAKAHAGTPFAGDFAAGHAGMLVPTTVIGAAARFVIPALMQYRAGGQPTTPERPAEPPPGAMTKMWVNGYAAKVYPAWLEKNPTKPCPTMTELAKSVAEDAVTEDEWGKPMVILCGKDLPAGVTGIAVVSPGPDGKLGTDDDVKSY